MLCEVVSVKSLLTASCYRDMLDILAGSPGATSLSVHFTTPFVATNIPQLESVKLAFANCIRWFGKHNFDLFLRPWHTSRQNIDWAGKSIESFTQQFNFFCVMIRSGALATVLLCRNYLRTKCVRRKGSKHHAVIQCEMEKLFKKAYKETI